MQPTSQPVVAPLTRAAIFLTLTVNPGDSNPAVIRSFCGDLAPLLRAVGFRDLEGNLSCIMGVGSDVWDELFGSLCYLATNSGEAYEGKTPAHSAGATPEDA